MSWFSFGLCRDIHTINLKCLYLFTIINCNSMQSDSPSNVNASQFEVKSHPCLKVPLSVYCSIYSYLFDTAVCHALFLIY